MTDALATFHFLRPWWLLLVVPAVLLAGLRLLRRAQRQQWKGVIAPHLLEHLITRPSRRAWLAPEIMALPVALITALAMAGPAYRLTENPDVPDSTTLLIVVDLSSSMAGTDIGPCRICRLKLKLRDLIDLRRGSKTGLIAVAGGAHVVMPPTDDGDALIPYVDVLDPKLMPSDGEQFADAAPLIRALAESSPGPTLALIAADSIPPEGASALGALQRQGISLLGWEIGTRAGIPGSGVPGLDRTGFLELERAGADLMELSLGDADLRRIRGRLDQVRATRVSPQNNALWEDSGYGLVFVIAIGTLFWFRRGWVIGRVATLSLFLSLTGCSGSKGTSAWLDLWLTPDQQGQRLIAQGKFAEAAREFEDPMWKGLAYYAAAQWKPAQEQFARVESPEGLFNLGNAHAQAKELASAIASYDQALQKRPTFLAARKNRDYFAKILAGLEQTTDFETLETADLEAADPTKVTLRANQQEGPRDLAAEASQADEKKSLSKSESTQWMKRVTTNPAEFLRAKFATQEARKTQ